MQNLKIKKKDKKPGQLELFSDNGNEEGEVGRERKEGEEKREWRGAGYLLRWLLGVDAGTKPRVARWRSG